MRLPFGPGALVAAAFIGPGTVTACTLAGATFGFALVWVLVFSTLATIILQDMSARLGAGARLGLGEALLKGTDNPLLRAGVAILVLAALALGNSAYQAGNLAGGALGLEAAFAFDGLEPRVYVLGLAVVAGAFLLHGRYRVLEAVLIALVMVMSLAFIATLIITRPDLSALASGLIPAIPEGGLATTIALIGTTIVPYNLFLHAAAARDRWQTGDAASLAQARTDTRLSIGLGGLISIFILASAATTLFASGLSVEGAGDMARSIEPAFGPAARYLVGFGLAAAGLSSAITAPMATAYAVSELVPGGFGLSKGALFRIIALGVLFIGAVLASLGLRPVTVILVAQMANGLLLPVVAAFLLMTMNRRALLGDHVNGIAANVIGGIVVLIAAGLGLRLILRALQIL